MSKFCLFCTDARTVLSEHAMNAVFDCCQSMILCTIENVFVLLNGTLGRLATTLVEANVDP